MSEEFSTAKQIEYPNEIVDFSSTIKGLEDSDGDVNFKILFTCPKLLKRTTKKLSLKKTWTNS